MNVRLDELLPYSDTVTRGWWVVLDMLRWLVLLLEGSVRRIVVYLNSFDSKFNLESISSTDRVLFTHVLQSSVSRETNNLGHRSRITHTKLLY